MLANSWLYHYYTVQSKIQFGMPLDSAMRVPPGSGASSSTGYYTTHQQTHGGVAGGIGLGATGMSGVFGSHHAHHHHHHHTTAAASYHHHHPHMGATYGGVYHAEGGIELKEDQQQLFGFPTAGGLEPVDYSQVNGGGGGGGGSNGASTGCSQKSTQSDTPPPPKKRARNKLEPLYLHAERSPVAAITPEPDCYALHPSTVYSTAPPGAAAGSSSDASTSVIYATIVPTRPRLLNKTLPPDPADFIEQWNPSPPWSESAQKASLDSFGSSHELSPCITTTPPTPTSATPQHGIGLGAQTVGPAFSFEWMSDPLVPVAYQQWPPATGDHHQHLSQHLAAAQLQQQQQQHQHQQHPQHLSAHHLQQQHPHTQHAQSSLHGVHVARVELAAESMVGTGRTDATAEPVEDRG